METVVPESFNTVQDEDEDARARDRLYRAIAVDVIEACRGKRGGREVGREVLRIVTEVIFQHAVREGYFRFPSGFGSLKVQRLKRDPVPKRLPNGRMVTLPPNRVNMRYDEGAAVRELLGMPKHTNYARQYQRRPKLSPRALELLRAVV